MVRWSDFWVSDSGDGKLYAYDFSDKSRQSDKEFNLDNPNTDPGEIWSDGQTVWVLDTADKHAYAYKLSTGERRRGKEFSTVPENDNPNGGFTGHGLRFWAMDSSDEKVYAYGKVNTPPTFSETSAKFKFHHSIAAGDYIGSVPDATDPDGDTITYLLTSGGFGQFRLDSQTGEIFLRDDASGFSGGEKYTLTVAIHDGRGGLDGFDSSVDDAIKVKIKVTHNSNPDFVTKHKAVFTVAEDTAADSTFAQIEVTDLDEDSLLYELRSTSAYHFTIDNGQLKLKQGETLDYEGRKFYALTVRVRDSKNRDDEVDLTWDDEIGITIQVTNVDEDGEVTLSSSQLQVGTAIVATLFDPDGVIVGTDDQVTWSVSKGADPTASTPVWNSISTNQAGGASFEYTPVALDAGQYLRFQPSYTDGYDAVNAKTELAVSDYAVSALPLQIRVQPSRKAIRPPAPSEKMPRRAAM